MDELSRYFDILEIRRGASLEEVKRAYRDMAQVWHPDRYAHNPRLRAKAEEKLKNINEAYQKISAHPQRSGANTSQPRKSSSPPPTSTRSTDSSARTGPSEKKPPPNTSTAPPKPQRTSATTTPPPSVANTSKKAGCILAACVMLGLIILIVSSQKDTDTRAASGQSFPAKSNHPGELSSMKADIEDRVARKDAEFDRLERWYQQGVSPQEEAVYRAALERVQDAEQDIAALILKYNERKKNSAPPPPQTPVVRTYAPQRGGILFDRYPGDAGPGKLTVHNGTDTHAICKLIDTYSGNKVCSFLILANTKDGISGIPDGTYRIIFAYGHNIIDGTDRFAAPSGFSEFKDRFAFSTIPTTSGYQYSTYSITLHKVAGGNAQTNGISANEFNKY